MFVLLQELNFVLWTTHPKTGDDANRGDRITKNEIATALDVWRTWEQTLPEVMASSSSCCSSASSSSVGSDSDADLSTLCVQVEPLMAKYDVNHSGKLEFEQLKVATASFRTCFRALLGQHHV